MPYRSAPVMPLRRGDQVRLPSGRIGTVGRDQPTTRSAVLVTFVDANGDMVTAAVLRPERLQKICSGEPD